MMLLNPVHLRAVSIALGALLVLACGFADPPGGDYDERELGAPAFFVHDDDVPGDDTTAESRSVPLYPSNPVVVEKGSVGTTIDKGDDTAGGVPPPTNPEQPLAIHRPPSMENEHDYHVDFEDDTRESSPLMEDEHDYHVDFESPPSNPQQPSAIHQPSMEDEHDYHVDFEDGTRESSPYMDDEHDYHVDFETPTPPSPPTKEEAELEQRIRDFSDGADAPDDESIEQYIDRTLFGLPPPSNGDGIASTNNPLASGDDGEDESGPMEPMREEEDNIFAQALHELQSLHTSDDKIELERYEQILDDVIATMTPEYHQEESSGDEEAIESPSTLPASFESQETERDDVQPPPSDVKLESIANSPSHRETPNTIPSGTSSNGPPDSIDDAPEIINGDTHKQESLYVGPQSFPNGQDAVIDQEIEPHSDVLREPLSSLDGTLQTPPEDDIVDNVPEPPIDDSVPLPKLDEYKAEILSELQEEEDAEKRKRMEQEMNTNDKTDASSTTPPQPQSTPSTHHTLEAPTISSSNPSTTPKVQESVPSPDAETIEPNDATSTTTTTTNVVSSSHPDTILPVLLDKSNDRFNHCSLDCGAKVLSSNPEAQGNDKVLKLGQDIYRISPCNVDNWLEIELCEEIAVESLEIANFEFFSSTFKKVAVYGSSKYTGRSSEGQTQWVSIGNLSAYDTKKPQLFVLEEPKWYRYLRLEVLSSHGSEYYCPITHIKAYGYTHLDRLKSELAEAAEQTERVRQKIKSRKENDTIVTSSTAPSGKDGKNPKDDAAAGKGDVSPAEQKTNPPIISPEEFLSMFGFLEDGGEENDNTLKLMLEGIQWDLVTSSAGTDQSENTRWNEHERERNNNEDKDHQNDDAQEIIGGKTPIQQFSYSDGDGGEESVFKELTSRITQLEIQQSLIDGYLDDFAKLNSQRTAKLNEYTQKWAQGLHASLRRMNHTLYRMGTVIHRVVDQQVGQRLELEVSKLRKRIAKDRVAQLKLMMSQMDVERQQMYNTLLVGIVVTFLASVSMILCISFGGQIIERSTRLTSKSTRRASRTKRAAHAMKRKGMSMGNLLPHRNYTDDSVIPSPRKALLIPKTGSVDDADAIALGDGGM